MSPKSPVPIGLQQEDPSQEKIHKETQEQTKTICFCHSVSLGELRVAYESGARTLKAIQKETLASTGCGGCELDVLDLMDEFTKSSETVSESG